MQAPTYLLPQPEIDADPKREWAFEALWQSVLDQPDGRALDYHLPYPKWQFLSFLGSHKDVVLHGTAHQGIEVLEPRQALDVKEFSMQRAIYATTDGIFAIFFSILNRPAVPMSLCNTCLRVRFSPEIVTDPFFFFSITQSALDQGAFCPGAVYVLPRQGFVFEPPLPNEGVEVLLAQCFSREAARPLCRLLVEPGDFPFLEQIRGHDDAVLQARAQTDPNGFPWLDEQQTPGDA
jgi:hypothetical protein